MTDLDKSILVALVVLALSGEIARVVRDHWRDIFPWRGYWRTKFLVWFWGMHHRVHMWRHRRDAPID